MMIQEILASSDAVDDGRRIRAELAMAVGGFGIGTGEFVIMGLLPDVAESANASIPEAAYAISAYSGSRPLGARFEDRFFRR
jgi:DHA1 family inner membrane transport protein